MRWSNWFTNSVNIYTYIVVSSLTKSFSCFSCCSSRDGYSTNTIFYSTSTIFRELRFFSAHYFSWIPTCWLSSCIIFEFFERMPVSILRTEKMIRWKNCVISPSRLCRNNNLSCRLVTKVGRIYTVGHFTWNLFQVLVVFFLIILLVFIYFILLVPLPYKYTCATQGWHPW